MPIKLADHINKSGLLPFTHTRSSADVRVGIFTIREKWEFLTGEEVIVAEDGISTQFMPTQEDYLQIKEGTAITDDIRMLNYAWEIYQHNAWAIRSDFYMIINRKKTAEISSTNKVQHPENIFIEEGAVVEHCFLNASEGPIYIGKDALIMEGSMLRGPVAICNNAVVKMGAKIYGGTTIGPYCVAGGEIKNSVLSGYSNKPHDGYLGDSVIGEWCNIGAGCSTSNVKNNASDVIMKFPHLPQEMNVGMKAGLIMGDYSRVAINTSFNTGTYVGVCCNIFDRNFPEKYIPDFSWGYDRYEYSKALSDVSNWKAMKGEKLTESETKKLQEIYYKTFEK